tara:strand:- start:810 stop:1319 length:510 start_codon:yes stop_codon:yes gene_type:complete
MPEFSFNIACNKDSLNYVDDSATRYYCEYLWLAEKRKSNNYKDLKRANYINIDLSNMTKFINYEDHHCDKCSFESNFECMLTHERECLGFKEAVVFQRKVYSDAVAVCTICDKVFLHTCKTSTPIHQLNRHKKSCEKTVLKRLRSEIQKSLTNLNLNNLLDIKQFIQDI